MKKIKNISYLWILFLLPLISVAQVKIEDSELINAVKESPQEKVFIHYNTSLLLAGEYLYYKIYTLNNKTLVPSQLSTIAYVELQGENGVTVFRHKIGLENSTGEGDFFISTNVPSGNYKLLGYTRWMLNDEKQEFFQGDVVVVNPYTNDQEALLASVEDDEPSVIEDQATGSLDQNNNSDTSEETQNFGKRQRVELTLNGMQQLDPNGDYSVSVRKIKDLAVPEMAFSREVSDSELWSINSEEGIFLPELRGELFTGRIAAKDESQGVSLANKRVALSIPDENFILKISRTNEKGEFYFNVEDYNLAEDVILQVLGEERGNFNFILETHPKMEVEGLNFEDFHLTQEMEDLILEESVYNQIENGYFSVKPDTIRLPEQKLSFYGERMINYNLDDYTRFNTLKETFVEIVRDITISGGEELRIRGINPVVGSRMPPLLIVDGIIVQEHARLINFPARRIQSIGVLRDKYFYGPEVFHGIINVETVEKDFQEKLGADYHFATSLLRPQPEKSYFKQTYSPEANSKRTPDFRRQLLWNPTFDPESGSIEFYTSDVPGQYEVILQGFTSSGKGVTLKENILVK